MYARGTDTVTCKINRNHETAVNVFEVVKTYWKQALENSQFPFILQVAVSADVKIQARVGCIRHVTVHDITYNVMNQA